MSEYELIYLTSEYINRSWTVIQVWAGISFGLVAVSHFFSKNLNVLWAVALTVLYVCFSIFSMSIFKANGHIVSGFILDLAGLGESSVELSIGAQRIIETKPGPIAMPSILLAFFGTFLGALWFLWWSFFRNRKKVGGR